MNNNAELWLFVGFVLFFVLVIAAIRVGTKYSDKKYQEKEEKFLAEYPMAKIYFSEFENLSKSLWDLKNKKEKVEDSIKTEIEYLNYLHADSDEFKDTVKRINIIRNEHAEIVQSILVASVTQKNLVKENARDIKSAIPIDRPEQATLNWHIERYGDK